MISSPESKPQIGWALISRSGHIEFVIMGEENEGPVYWTAVDWLGCYAWAKKYTRGNDPEFQAEMKSRKWRVERVLVHPQYRSEPRIRKKKGGKKT